MITTLSINKILELAKDYIIGFSKDGGVTWNEVLIHPNNSILLGTQITLKDLENGVTIQVVSRKQ